VVLEAREPGWGASGRNGGQVIPGIKYDPSELIARYGTAGGEALTRFVGSTADRVFELIARHEMDVPFVRAGWIQGAHTPAMVETVKRRAGEW
uniref:FAD-dependent oxidoreductase n=1 Tax=Enterobacter hormaechei TaxID=158836 RepID=UPI0013D07844